MEQANRASQLGVMLIETLGGDPHRESGPVIESILRHPNCRPPDAQ